ncbi:hypothetical protein D6777_04775 [Candidatus Woesearchaeota archaeon]|nr:MAG: hypothetical protein D6777_04775 [Candidatus Woesearchaeota archaeon]
MVKRRPKNIMPVENVISLKNNKMNNVKIKPPSKYIACFLCLKIPKTNPIMPKINGTKPMPTIMSKMSMPLKKFSINMSGRLCQTAKMPDSRNALLKMIRLIKTLTKMKNAMLSLVNCSTLKDSMLIRIKYIRKATLITKLKGWSNGKRKLRIMKDAKCFFKLRRLKMA